MEQGFSKETQEATMKLLKEMIFITNSTPHLGFGYFKHHNFSQISLKRP